MINEAKTRLKDHSKAPSSVHKCILGETVLARVRTVKYKLSGFIEIDNQSIKMS